MRDLLRLVGIGVLVFVIVGFSMLYSRDSAFRHGVSVFLSNGWAALGRTFSWGAGDDHASNLSSTELRLLRPKQTLWLGLAGFPDQTEIVFPLPVGGGFVSGELDLRLDSQLAEGGDGLLSIAINGARRSVIVINQGHNVYNVRIPLEERDLLADHVVLQLSGRGTTNSGQICPTESANSGAAISVLPESAIILRSMRESEDPETDLLAMTEPLNLQLGRNEESQAIAVWSMQLMERAGVEAVLVDSTQTSPSIVVVTDNGAKVSRARNGNITLAGREGVARAIALHSSDLQSPDRLSSWPVPVSDLTTETTTRNFRGSRRWTIPYKIADLPEGMMPTNFKLALKTSILAEDAEWVVRVSLNGNLLEAARFPGNRSDFNLDVTLPTHVQGLVNSLLIELIDTSPNQSVCRVGPDAQAQLLPESQFTASGPQPDDGWGALVRALAQASLVSPGNHGTFSVIQGTRAAAMLGQFLPAGVMARFAPEDAEMTITLIDKNRLETLLDGIRAGEAGSLKHAQLITDTGNSVMNPLSLHRLEEGMDFALLNRMHSTDIAFIVQRPSKP